MYKKKAEDAVELQDSSNFWKVNKKGFIDTEPYYLEKQHEDDELRGRLVLSDVRDNCA